MNEMEYMVASAKMRQHLLDLMATGASPTLSTLLHLMRMDWAVIGDDKQ